jgi:hypothetical protein
MSAWTRQHDCSQGQQQLSTARAKTADFDACKRLVSAATISRMKPARVSSPIALALRPLPLFLSNRVSSRPWSHKLFFVARFFVSDGFRSAALASTPLLPRTCIGGFFSDRGVLDDLFCDSTTCVRCFLRSSSITAREDTTLPDLTPVASRDSRPGTCKRFGGVHNQEKNFFFIYAVCE